MSSGDEIVTVLRTLGIRSSEDALRAFLKHATQSRLGPIETLEHLAGIEQRERERRNLERRTRSAQLGQALPLDRFDWSHARKLDRALVQSLLRLDFIEHGENVLFPGPSGVGKTTLARALGYAALEQGFVVRFSTLAAFLTDLLRQESAPALERRLKRYITPDVLILDEVGYLPCDSKAADLLYAVVDRRHEQRSTIVTTNQTRYAPSSEELDADPGARYWGAGTVEARALDQRTRWSRGGCCCFTHTAAGCPWFMQRRRILRNGRRYRRSCRRS